jgi:hypothetical protein
VCCQRDRDERISLLRDEEVGTASEAAQAGSEPSHKRIINKVGNEMRMRALSSRQPDLEKLDPSVPM